MTASLRNVCGGLALLGTLCIPWSVQAASFDCAKAATKVEKLICKSPHLSRMDGKLDELYHQALVKTHDKRQIKTSQRHWLFAMRNACEDEACLQRVYDERIITLTTLISTASKEYHFTLVQGRGVAVCEAYLKRLNTADYAIPPYCNIPEETQVPGFTPLQRVPLTAEGIAEIAPRVEQLNVNGDQGSKEEDAKYRAWKIRHNVMVQDPLDTAKSLLQGGWKIWRYEPPVDIENDGTPVNVLVWQEGGCGHPIQTVNVVTDGRKPTLAYVLTTDNSQLDIPKTKAIFGDPSGGYPNIDDTIFSEFRPLGPTIGIFKYQHLYYIDTFLFDKPVQFWGWISSGAYIPKHANTLAVFLHQHGKTHRVCTYHMTETQ